MGEEELENHFVANDDIEIEWNNYFIRNTEAEQSRHSSVIKQAVKSNNKDCDFGYKRAAVAQWLTMAGMS
ncbi:hypothetical protein TNCV_2157431 [Trichonephila clavipes]|nr:hypothetical protein TNCV_2157431 [Trichonephila clavipes]